LAGLAITGKIPVIAISFYRARQPVKRKFYVIIMEAQVTHF
jgi:hypothetical protein